MNVQELLRKKELLGLTDTALSELAGVPPETVRQISSDPDHTPDKQTIRKLALAIQAEESARSHSSHNDPAGDACSNPADFSCRYSDSQPQHQPDTVREGAASYAEPLRGPYTIEDYYALPDDRRVELIDGYIYDMGAPRPIHQIILQQLYLQLFPCVEKHPECELFLAPCDVRLDRDQWTMVQPDVFVICDIEQITKKRIEGAPGFVIEVLSPSSRAHDMVRKLNKYRFAGVQEYWIADPENLEILVYDLAKDTHPEKYSFSDTIPVKSSKGECCVDFQRIEKKIRRYL